jgi:hypothetical protein
LPDRDPVCNVDQHPSNDIETTRPEGSVTTRRLWYGRRAHRRSTPRRDGRSRCNLRGIYEASTSVKAAPRPVHHRPSVPIFIPTTGGHWAHRALPDHPDLRRHQPDPADGRRPQDLHGRAVIRSRRLAGAGYAARRLPPESSRDVLLLTAAKGHSNLGEPRWKHFRPGWGPWLSVNMP